SFLWPPASWANFSLSSLVILAFSSLSNLPSLLVSYLSFSSLSSFLWSLVNFLCSFFPSPALTVKAKAQAKPRIGTNSFFIVNLLFVICVQLVHLRGARRREGRQGYRAHPTPSTED